MRGVLFLATILVGSLLFTACGGNRYVYQTRYMPRRSELSYDKDYEQLVWQPPAVGEFRQSSPGRSARPAFAPEINFDVDFKSSQASRRSERQLERAAEGKTYNLNTN